MDLIEWKTRFEASLNPLAGTGSARGVWEIYKLFLLEPVDGDFEEEISFNAGPDLPAGGHFFQVYFGRLIDRIGPGPARTLEVNLYLRYGMTPALQALAAQTGGVRVETVVRSGADPAATRDFVRQVEGLTELWRALDGRAPAGRDFQFQVW